MGQVTVGGGGGERSTTAGQKGCSDGHPPPGSGGTGCPSPGSAWIRWRGGRCATAGGQAGASVGGTGKQQRPTTMTGGDGSKRRWWVRAVGGQLRHPYPRERRRRERAAAAWWDGSGFLLDFYFFSPKNIFLCGWLRGPYAKITFFFMRLR